MSTIYYDKSKKLLNELLKEDNSFKKNKKEIKDILDTDIKVTSPHVRPFKEPIISFMEDSEIELHSGIFLKEWYENLKSNTDEEYSFKDFLEGMFISDFSLDKLYIIGFTGDTDIGAKIENIDLKSFISAINVINYYCDRYIKLEKIEDILQFDKKYNITSEYIDLSDDGGFIVNSLEITSPSSIRYEGIYIPNYCISDEELISGVFDKEDIIYEDGERKIYTSIVADVDEDELEEHMLDDSLGGVVNIGWENWSF